MITAKEARELVNSHLAKEKCNSLNEVCAMICMASENGESYLSNIKLTAEDYYKLCDGGFVVKSMDNGYSINW